MDGGGIATSKSWIIGPLLFTLTGESYVVRYKMAEYPIAKIHLRLLLVYYNNANGSLSQKAVVRILAPENKLAPRSISALLSTTRTILEKVGFDLETRIKKYAGGTCRWIPVVGDPPVEKQTLPSSFSAIKVVEKEVLEPAPKKIMFRVGETVQTLEGIPNFKKCSILPKNSVGKIIGLARLRNQRGDEVSWARVNFGPMEIHNTPCSNIKKIEV